MTLNTLDQDLATLHQLSAQNDQLTRAKQLNLIDTIYATGINGQEKLLEFLIERAQNKCQHVSCIDGFIFESLLESKDSHIVNYLNRRFQNGIVPLKSGCNIDYLPLQKLLISKRFQEADQVTRMKLCELSRKVGNHKRDWLYFTDILLLPGEDLSSIDQLWQVHSKGLFGLSVQRNIWLAQNSNWEKLWSKIGWKVDQVACRYPKEFVWDLSAPAGHLPLSNQLRGVQVLASLFLHPVWTNSLQGSNSNTDFIY
jgi:hypothetical protein